MRRHLFSSAITSVSMAMLGVLAAVAIAGNGGCSTPASSSTAPTNLRYGAYRGSISRSGKPRGTYNKRGLSTSARKRGIAGSKKRWRKGRGK